MSNIRCSLKAQITLLCRQAAQIAFDYRPFPPVSGHLQGAGTLFSVIHTCSAPREIYEEYRRAEFKYADPGITPKLISQEMEIHMKAAGDLVWDVDEFGCFRFGPTGRYLRAQRDLIKQKGHFQFLSCGEFDMWGPSAYKSERQTHYFDYYVDGNTSLSQARKINLMEMKSRVLEKLNGHRVIRTIFTNSLSRSGTTIEKITSTVLRAGTQAREISSLSAIDRPSQKQGRVFQYFGCDNHDRIAAGKQLPHHELISDYLGSEYQPLREISTQSIVSFLKEQPRGMVNNPINIKDLGPEMSLEEVIVIYGNLLDTHDFASVQILLEQARRKWDCCSPELDILQDSYAQVNPFYRPKG